MEINKIIYYFVIGSFVGYEIEIIFKILTNNEVTAGLFNGPYCILYGIGVVFISMCLGNKGNSNMYTFLFCMLWLTLFEFATGVLLEKVYNKPLWDYSEVPLCLGNKICIPFSLVWGILGMIYIKYGYPLLEFIRNNTNQVFLNAGIFIFFIIIITDVFYTNIKMLKFA